MAKYEIGEVVYDAHSEMPAVVTDFKHHMIRLERPSGLNWWTREIALRPADAYQKRQLEALSRHAILTAQRSGQ